MTLVLNVAKSDFVLMTADSRVVYTQYYLDTLERANDTMRISQEKGEKVIKLTDYVLIAKGGVKEIGDDLCAEMQARVKPGDDLKKCGQVLREVITEFRKGTGSNYSDFLDRENAFECIMSGFYHTGRTGQITFLSGSTQQPTEIRYPKDQDVYIYSLIPPVSDYVPIAGDLFRLEGEHTLRRYTDHLVTVHSIISHLQPDRVSADCNCFVLHKPHRNMRKPLFSQVMFDTSTIQQHLPAKEDLKSSLFATAK